MATIADARLRVSFEEQTRKFNEWVKVLGYRPPTRADLVAGAELLMVDVERYMSPHNQGMTFTATGSGTRIKLDDEPIKPSRIDPDKEVVYYHCVMPSWNGQCFVRLDDFCASGYVKGDPYANDTRYVIKA